MNLRKLKNQAGFTLVELIVVIAIMAILAGVAVPVYSGYIEKANKAADLQLLGAVNSAFGAACIENDTDVHSVEEDVGTPSIINYEDIAVSMFDDEFQVYFAGNEGGFKVIKQLLFVNGAFVDPTSGAVEGVVSATYAGQTVYFTEKQIENLKNSTYGKIGTDSLLDQIDFVTDIAAGMANGTLEKVFKDPDFIQAAMGALGFKSTESAEFNAKYIEMYKQMAKEQGITEGEAQAKLNANAAVLYAADNALNYTDEQISALFADGSVTSANIIANLTGSNGNSATGMADTALVYGMYLAYANSDTYGNDTLKANANSASAVLDALQTDTNFLKYANSAEGKADMNAYLGSLDMIVNSADTDPSVVEDLMLNGFNNTEIKTTVSGAVNGTDK